MPSAFCNAPSKTSPLLLSSDLGNAGRGLRQLDVQGIDLMNASILEEQ